MREQNSPFSTSPSFTRSWFFSPLLY